MNNPIPQKILPLIRELQALNILEHDEATNITRVSKILSCWVNQNDWLEEHYLHVDVSQGFSSWLLHEELDHSLAINLLAWQPHFEITPHDHNTWGVVGCVRGVEENYFWTRLDDRSKPGYAKIERQNPPIICLPGDIIGLKVNDIHSVVNTSDAIAISLHVYGKNLNYTNRCQYDPINNKAEPFIVDFNNA